MNCHQVDAAIVGFCVCEGDADAVEFIFVAAFDVHDLKDFIIWNLRGCGGVCLSSHFLLPVVVNNEFVKLDG